MGQVDQITGWLDGLSKAVEPSTSHQSAWRVHAKGQPVQRCRHVDPTSQLVGIEGRSQMTTNPRWLTHPVNWLAWRVEAIGWLVQRYQHVDPTSRPANIEGQSQMTSNPRWSTHPVDQLTWRVKAKGQPVLCKRLANHNKRLVVRVHGPV